jgi:hypothetical protein
MNCHFSKSDPVIDHQISRSIRDGIAEALLQSLRPEASQLSPHLQRLMDELRKRDNWEHRQAR